MTRRPRRNHSPAFKVKVALAAMVCREQMLVEALDDHFAREREDRRDLASYHDRRGVEGADER